MTRRETCLSSNKLFTFFPRSYDSTHLHDPTGTKSGLCDSFLFKRKLMANFGQSVHLSCSLGQVEMTGGPEVEWHHYSKSR